MRRPIVALVLVAALHPAGMLEAQELRERPGCRANSYESQYAYDSRCDAESEQSAAAAAAHQRAMAALRKKLLAQPALAASKNPLLGRWRRTGQPAAGKDDFFGQINGMVSGLGCDLLVGGGEFEFRASTWVDLDPEGELVLAKVEYRSGTLDGKKVVFVLPDRVFTLMSFGVRGVDRIQVMDSPVECILERVKPTTRPAAAVAPAATAASTVPATPGTAPPLVVVKPAAPQLPLPGAGFKIAGVTLGVDNIPAVVREVAARGGELSPVSSFQAPTGARAYGRDADYSSLDPRVFAAAYDFEQDDAAARLVAVTFYWPTDANRTLFAERVAYLIQEFSLDERATGGVLVATLAGGVQLTLEDVPVEGAVKETYALPTK